MFHIILYNMLYGILERFAPDLTAYSSAINFTRLIPGTVCVQAEGMLNPMKTLVLIQHHVERILEEKIKFS